MGKPSSDIYKYFIERDGRYYCAAEGCAASYKKTGSTGNMVLHHRVRHYEEEEPFAKWRRIQGPSLNETDAYESSVISFFSAYGIPFQAVESPEFITMIMSCGGHPKTIGRKKLADEILAQEAERCEREVKGALNDEKISLCVDEYTKGSNRFASLTATLLNSSFQHRTVRIAVVSLNDERATAENLQVLIEDQLRRYEVNRQNIVALTRDGGSNMVKLARLMALQSVHCFCHVLNLCIKQAVKVRGVNRIVSQVQALAVTFRSSPTMYKQFLNFSRGKTLKMPARTRWNSVYDLLQSFLNVHEQLRSFVTDQDSSNHTLTESIYTTLTLDTTKISELCKTLKFMKDVCLLAEGRCSPASIILYLIRRVENHCAKRSQSQSISSLSRDLIDAILHNIVKYKSAYLKNDLLMICTYLDPRFVNDQSIMSCTDWSRCRQLVIDSYEENVESPAIPPLCDLLDEDDEEDWACWRRQSHSQEGCQNSDIAKEIDIYARDVENEKLVMPDPKNTETSMRAVYVFWRRRKDRLPLLSAMARQYLPVCCSSAEPERVFSSLTHLLCNQQRSNLSDNNIERLMAIRQRLACRKLDQPLPDESSEDEIDCDVEEESLHEEQEETSEA
ncbi:hypothetical protein QR680_011760 [Steinernema hermaphroditum]|uniref:HAT C-terminal dimerisation domain-containing protein n=1 Tax=Steinernema hermaphroditum TaxID=289476 RepID=A0AA39I1X6_9BILA|nr:hypothetical protein QR680_011760 [Steinernema hermaphroditum]